jgi:arginyl-tRNA synthetase
MNIVPLLDQKIRQAMTRAGVPESLPARVMVSNRAEFGDFQANGVLAAAKQMGQNPRELASKIVNHLDLSEIAEHLEIAGPGFINIHIARKFLTTNLNALAFKIKADGGWIHPKPDTIETIVVDYSSPNLAKEMHVGHLRSTIIGDSIARILEYQGHRVIRQNHMGDWGTQFGMLIAELEEQTGKGEQPQLALGDLEKFYQHAKVHFDSDPSFADKARDYVVKLQSGDRHCVALWQQFIDISIAHSEVIYHQLGVSLTREDIQPESAYNNTLAEIVLSLKDQGLAEADQGAMVVFVKGLSGSKKQSSPMIVQKSDGGYLYSTSDLAALRYRTEQLKADRILYLVDARQSLHLKQVFAIARSAGFCSEHVSLEHLSFGTMMGEDGKPFKTRTGGTIKLAELLTEAVHKADTLIADKNPDMNAEDRGVIAHKVGIGAVKYADLRKTRTNDYLFNWDSMLSFEGNTAPYLQYAYTRIRSILRRAKFGEEQGSTIDGQIDIATASEKQLAIKLLAFDSTIDQTAKDGFPHTLCNYVYELASTYMRFYESCPVLADEVSVNVRNSRLQLCNLTADTLQSGLNLLGIETMDRM